MCIFVYKHKITRSFSHNVITSFFTLCAYVYSCRKLRVTPQTYLSRPFMSFRQILPFSFNDTQRENQNVERFLTEALVSESVAYLILLLAWQFQLSPFCVEPAAVYTNYRFYTPAGTSI